MLQVFQQPLRLTGRSHRPCRKRLKSWKFQQPLRLTGRSPISEAIDRLHERFNSLCGLPVGHITGIFSHHFNGLQPGIGGSSMNRHVHHQTAHIINPKLLIVLDGGSLLNISI